jgi:hypothetical protein
MLLTLVGKVPFFVRDSVADTSKPKYLLIKDNFIDIFNFKPSYLLMRDGAIDTPKPSNFIRNSIHSIYQHIPKYICMF